MTALLITKNKSRRQDRVRGLTLTEMAIVFGVISMVLGTIWAVYGNVRTADQMRRTNRQLVTIAQNIRTLFAEQGGVRGTAVDLMPALDNMKVFPIEMRANPPTSGVIFNIWSTQIGGNNLGTVYANADDCAGNGVPDDTTTEPCFAVTYINVPRSICEQILITGTSTGGLKSVLINGTSVTSPTNTLCTSAIANTIEWIYLLRDN